MKLDDAVQAILEQSDDEYDTIVALPPEVNGNGDATDEEVEAEEDQLPKDVSSTLEIARSSESRRIKSTKSEYRKKYWPKRN